MLTPLTGRTKDPKQYYQTKLYTGLGPVQAEMWWTYAWGVRWAVKMSRTYSCAVDIFMCRRATEVLLCIG